MPQASRPQNDPVVKWSTSDLPQGERAEALERLMSSDFILPVGFSRRLHEDVSADLQAASLDEQVVMHMRVNPVDSLECYRSTDQFQRSHDACLSVVQILGGKQQIVTGGNDLLARPGDVFLLDTEQDYRFGAEGPFFFRALHFRKSFLLDIMPHAYDYSGQVLRRSDGPVALFGAHMRALCRNRLKPTGEDLSGAMRVTGELLAYAMGASTMVGRHAMRTITFDRAREYIARNLSRGDLTPTRVAEALAISTRYLHLVFESYGITVGAWIRRQRLERCRRELAAAGHAGRLITEIAHSWGFRDGSHFAKLFRRAYGLSPRDYRAQAGERRGRAVDGG